MVERAHKSLSADSELNSAYDYLLHNDFKQRKKVIDKKLSKLKSSVDIANFKGLKLLLLFKTKKFKEVEQLKNELKETILKEKVLYTDDALMTYFYKIFREVNHEKTAAEIFREIKLNKTDLSKLDYDKREAVLKELVYNNDFSEVYKVLTKFYIPKESEPEKLRFYNILKYEMVYIMTFKTKVLKEAIAKLTFKEITLNLNKEEYRLEKGFLDIAVKFQLAFNDYAGFEKLYNELIKEENEKEKEKKMFTNAPIKDLHRDVLLKEGNNREVIISLVDGICSNLDKFDFSSYERLVNFSFSLLVEKIDEVTVKQISENLKESLIKIKEGVNQSKEKCEESSKNFKLDFELSKNLKEDKTNPISIEFFSVMISKFSEIISTFYNHSPYFNAVKSAILSCLMICFNFSQKFNFDGKINTYFQEYFTEVIQILLPRILNKQSVLFELIPYMIILDEKQRLLLSTFFDKEVFNTTITNTNNDLTLINKTVLNYKLKTLLNKSFTSSENIEKNINTLIQTYLGFQSNEKKQLEKGERLEYDDLVLLVNELYEKKESKDDSKYKILVLNSFAHSSSPYNYDITLKYLNSALENGLFNLSLELYKYMNLKGPQNETCSYIVFKDFLEGGFKPGLNLLINNFNKWESENKKSVKKTLWSMFKGRNFYFSSDLMSFSTETEASYIKHIFNTLELKSNIEEKESLLFDPSNEESSKSEEEVKEVVELALSESTLLAQIKREGYLIRNQDVLITMKKFSLENYDRKAVSTQVRNYLFELDSKNKESNILYLQNPDYKNNYISLLDNGIYSFFEKDEFTASRGLEEGILLDLFLGKYSKQTIQKIVDYKELVLKGNGSNSRFSRFFNENLKLVSLAEEVNKEYFLKLSDNPTTPEKTDLLAKYSTTTKEKLSSFYKEHLIIINSLIQAISQIGKSTNIQFIETLNEVNFYFNYSFKLFFIFSNQILKETFDIKRDLKEEYNEFKNIVFSNFKKPVQELINLISVVTNQPTWLLEEVKSSINAFPETETLLKNKEVSKLVEVDFTEERKSYLKFTQENIKQKKTLVQIL